MALLLLRRQRFYERPVESAPIAPSQMRKALGGHFMQFDLFDDADIPFAGLAFILTAPTGTKKTGRCNAEGTYREERTPEGNYELVLAHAEIDPIEEEHFVDIEVVDQSGMPVAGAKYQILVAGTEVRAGAIGPDGRGHVASLPPGPYDIVLPEFEPEAVTFNGAAAGKVQSTSRAGKTPIVQKGENLSKIARANGLKNWKALYDAPENAELRKKRPNPDRIRPGDEVKVPKDPVASGTSAGGQINRAVVPMADPPTMKRVFVDDALSGVLSESEVTLCFEDGSSATVLTGKDGAFEVDYNHEYVDVTLRPSDVPRRIFLGPPDPGVSEGAWQRLCNLGYVDAPLPSALPDETMLRSAIASFEEDHGMPVSGDLVEPMCGKLAKAHDDHKKTWVDRAWTDGQVVDDGAQPKSEVA